MTKSRLHAFMDEAGSRPYRELVEHHLRHQSEAQLQIASLGEISGLSTDMRADVERFIDVVNSVVGLDSQFWETATCRDAYDRFIELAIGVFHQEGFVGNPTDPMWLEDEELAFQLFQIPTLSFAYSASGQRAQRKGIFG